MATITRHGRGTGQPKDRIPIPSDPSCQPCPDCGGLECLCRPRFFAGQLLSEQDLNRLDHYIVEKHKLHNRHLWGSGVVCGLEVKCAPCVSGFVTVTSGYALSPCGEDIVVCKSDMVDICALIAQSRGFCGSSLHGRIVALAFALPRVNLRSPASLDHPGKQAAFATAWDDDPMPSLVDIDDLAAGLDRALDSDPAVRERRAAELVRAYRDGFDALCAGLT